MTDTYVYPLTSNRLSQIQIAGTTNRDMTYDAAGNLTYDTRPSGSFGFAYNEAGRMESVSKAGVIQGEYLYNEEGQQVVRETSSTGAVINVIHDLSGNRIAEYDGSTGALLTEYVWLGLEPLAAVTGGNMYFIRTDHIGKPVLATDSLGVVASTINHKPFGEVHTSTGLDTGLRFPGQVYHWESELHQNWMRDYDPTTGRYIQGDPLGLVDGASVYAYALQSPGRFIDPRGEQSVVFDGSSVNTFDSSGRQISSIPAVSGRPESCQCSDDMYKSNFGPTPEGSYSVDPNAINRWNVFKAVTGWGSREAWGKQRTILVPDGHTAGGRTQMYIHGGKYPGSSGCIDLTNRNDEFHDWLSKQSGPVSVIVDYPDNNSSGLGPF